VDEAARAGLARRAEGVLDSPHVHRDRVPAADAGREAHEVEDGGGVEDRIDPDAGLAEILE
jgi:hypothetical protein